MAIVHQASTTASGTGTSLTINKPIGTAAGDVLVAYVYPSNGLVSPPAGWTQLAFIFATYVFYRVMDGTEGASFTWTVNSGPWSGGISRYAGVDGATPIDTTVSTDNTGFGSATSITVPSVTTTTANAMVVGGAFFGGTGISPPGSLTERWEVTGSVEHASATQAGAGATGAKTWTAGSSNSWEGWLTALREANPSSTVIDPSFIATAEQVYQPAVVGNAAIVPNFIASAETVFAPQVKTNTNTAPAFIASSEVVYQPQVTVTGGPVSLFPPFIASAEAVYQPAVAVQQGQIVRIKAAHEPQINTVTTHDPA